MQAPLYCEVILPLSVKGTYTYRVPEEWKDAVVPGIRVEVQFGRRKHYTAIVKSLHHQAPAAYQAKEIFGVVDTSPIVTEHQLKFWEWIAQYYCCYEGEVMTAAMPAYFRPDSETQYVRHPESEVNILDLPDDEYLVASALERQDTLSLGDIQIILQRKSVQKIIRSLIDKQVIVLQEFLEDRYKPKLEVYTRLHPDYITDKTFLHQLFQKLEKKPKQSDLLLAYISAQPQGEWMSRSELIKSSGVSGSVHRTMVGKDIFQNEEKIISRVEEEQLHHQGNHLNEEQRIAYDQIRSCWEKQFVVLLRGVTASGKTHVYAELIRDTINEGKQVLYLVPEIALTTQLIRRLETMLGKVGVYHSKYNPAERVETWMKVLQQEYNIVIGARSSMFLPFPNLGLIIVDEEHDGSYKQNDPAPRYQARDSVIFLANLISAKVLLGSATPSMESWANAQAGRFGLVELTKRHGEMSLPQLFFINMTEARKNKQVTGMLSDAMQIAIGNTLKNGKQAIIFQNRRGYAPYISCKDCAWIPHCQHCDVSLTFHKFSEQLKCHYCGYTMLMPRECPSCQSTVLEMKGAGTERVEDDIQAIFPQARLLRLDYDTAKSKYAHEKIIDQFEQGEADILIGTQMVTKGLDFKNVQMVGVLNADALLHYPDFRATERAYQLLSQVSGRAGRSDEVGKVYIQISNPEHPITHRLKEHSLVPYYTKELSERMKFHYPPFVRMIHISVRDADERVVADAAAFVYKQLQPRFIGECLGPSVPSLSRLQGKYIRDIIIKTDRNSSQVAVAKRAIEEVRQMLYQYAIYKKVRLVVDVDP